jgi:hypothetical protein
LPSHFRSRKDRGLNASDPIFDVPVEDAVGDVKEEVDDVKKELPVEVVEPKKEEPKKEVIEEKKEEEEVNITAEISAAQMAENERKIRESERQREIERERKKKKGEKGLSLPIIFLASIFFRQYFLE